MRADIEPGLYRAAKRRAALGALLSRSPRVLKAVGLAAHGLRYLTDSALMHRENQVHLPMANADSTEPLGYASEGEEIAAWQAYRRDVRSGRIERTESGELHRRQWTVLGDLIERDPSARNVLNFGVCYPHIDSLLAARFPQVVFTGIDRSPLTKALNDSEFGDVENMAFVAGDVFGYNLDHTDVLTHSRTAICLNRPTLSLLYRKARLAGVKYIVGFEQIGTSWETFEPYDFDQTDRPSVLYRNFMFIHNYPGLLRAAGYALEGFDIFRTASGKPDLRIAAFVASLRD